MVNGNPFAVGIFAIIPYCFNYAIGCRFNRRAGTGAKINSVVEIINIIHKTSLGGRAVTLSD